METRCIRIGDILRIRHHLDDEIHEEIGQRQDAYYRNHVEEGVEHRKLGLRNTREGGVENGSEIHPSSGG